MPSVSTIPRSAAPHIQPEGVQLSTTRDRPHAARSTASIATHHGSGRTPGCPATAGSR
jgi:hypothetical protein